MAHQPLVPLAAAVVSLPLLIWVAQETANSFGQQNSGWYGRLQVGLLLAGLIFQYSMFNRFIFERRARSKGCQPAGVFPFKEPILGLDLFLDNLRAIKANRLLFAFRDRFEEFGRHTYWAKNLGQWILFTDEPENIKAILATNFEDFAIAGPRLYSLVPLLGSRSIFTTNGENWQKSRAMIRPSFVRNQVADLECFNRHIGNLLDKIPRDGSTFDLQELLMAMTMDSSTDFM